MINIIIIKKIALTMATGNAHGKGVSTNDPHKKEALMVISAATIGPINVNQTKRLVATAVSFVIIESSD